MAFELNETASITLRIEGDKARNELALLEADAKKLERALKEAPKGSQEWADLYKELGKNGEAQKALRTEVGLTGLTFSQLEKEARAITKEMKGMTEGTEEYAAKSARLKEVNSRLTELRQDYRALDTDTKKFTASIADWDNESKRATLTTRQLKDVAAQLDEQIKDLIPGTKEHAAATTKLNEVNKTINSTLQEQPSRWKQVQTAIVAVVGAFSLMSVAEKAFAFIKKGVTDALALTDAMADVAKSTGQSTEQVAALADELDKIDTRTTKEALMDIAKVGGQLGIANDELTGFVKSVDMAVVALGDEFTGGAEQAAKEIGSLQKLFKETKDMKAGDAINDIGSALNALGAAGSATAPSVADFTKRIGQLGDLSPEISQTMGLGAAFEELGLSAEISAGGLTNILLSAAKGTAIFAQQLGISEKEMKNLINTNPNEFLLKLAESLRGLPADQVAKRLAELGIKSQEATKVMSLLKDQTGYVREKQELANKAMKEGTSLMQEFKLKNTTAAAELEKTQKNVAKLATDIGMSLLPYLTKALSGFVSFVNVIRAVPQFINENRTTLIALGVALISFNAQSILAAANTLRLAAAEKIATIQKGASAVAQRLLNAAMTANPIGLVITVVMLLVAAFTALYNNSITVRAGVNGLFTAMKVAAGELLRFWEALKNLNFAEAATIMTEGGKKIAAGFNKGYADTMAAEQPKHLAAHKKLVDDKKTTTVQGAVETGNLEALEDEKTLAKKSAAAKKHREEQDKDNETLRIKTRDANIDAISNELDRERAKIKAKFDDEVAAIQATTASEAAKNEAIKALNARMQADLQAANQTHVEKVRADQQKALDLQREYQISLETDEKARKTLDAQFKYEKEKERIEKEITDENQRATTLTALETKLKADLNQINTEFRDKEREANNQLRSAEQAAEIAQLNLKELQAGNNAQKLLSIKKERLEKEYEFLRENMRREKDEELLRIQESNMSQEQKTALQKSINQKYLADVGAATRQHTADMTALDQQAVAEKKARYEAFSSAFKSLLNGDFQAFAEQSANIVKGEKAAWQERMTENMAKYDAVADIAKAGAQFLNKLTQDRLDKEIAASKKETKQRLDDSEKRMKAEIEAAEKTAAKEMKAAGTSAEKRKEVEAKLAAAKKDISAKYEKDKNQIQQDGATKEKELARKKWEADKKMQIATAIMSGAQAALKALASGIFPINLIFAGIVAGLTAVQVIKIKNQPAPQFERGGLGRIADGQVQPMYGEGGIDMASAPDSFREMFGKGTVKPGYFRNAGVLKGGRHGSRYGERGISMIDRESGREVGEAEGGEPFMILSRNTYANNKGVVDRLLYSSLYRNGQKIAYENGGVGGRLKGIGSISETPYFDRKMMLFGSKKKKREAEEAAAAAEAEAKKAEAEANASMAAIYDGPTSGDEGDANGLGAASSLSGDAEAQAKQAAKMAQDQLDLLKKINEAVEKGGANTVDEVTRLAQQLSYSMYGLSTNLTSGLDRLDVNTQASTETQTTLLTLAIRSLSFQTNEGIISMGEDLRQGMETLATKLEAALDRLENTTVASLEKLDANTADNLAWLTLTTRTSLTALRESNKTSLADLSKNTDKSLTDLRISNKTSLGDLSKTTDKALTDLRISNKASLDQLGMTTENALNALSDDNQAGFNELIQTTRTSLDALSVNTLRGLNNMAGQVGGLRGAINGVEGAVRNVEGATRGVEGAVYNTNQAGRLDQLVSAISQMK